MVRKIKIVTVILLISVVGIWIGRIVSSGSTISTGKGKEVNYEICKKGHIPENLNVFIQSAKKNPCCFTLKDSENLYIVVCYGEKKYSGYSIQVKQFTREKGVLRVKTNLKGPSNMEPAVKEKNWPFIVLKCKRTDSLCIIES